MKRSRQQELAARQYAITSVFDTEFRSLYFDNWTDASAGWEHYKNRPGYCLLKARPDGWSTLENSAASTVKFDERDCGGAFDGFSVSSDADGGL